MHGLLINYFIGKHLFRKKLIPGWEFISCKRIGTKKNMDVTP